MLKIGTFTEHELALKRELAGKVMQILDQARGGRRTGWRRGAYPNCVDSIQVVRDECSSLDEQCGVDMLIKGLEAPFSQIVRSQRNLYPTAALMGARKRSEGYGFAMLSGQFVHMSEYGIVDRLAVARGALEKCGKCSHYGHDDRHDYFTVAVDKGCKQWKQRKTRSGIIIHQSSSHHLCWHWQPSAVGSGPVV